MEKTIRVLPFTGKKKDWPMWSKKFLARARARGYREVMLGKEQVPEHDLVLGSSDADKKKAKARKYNDDGYNELILSCDEEVSFGLVDEAVSDSLPDGDLAKAWSKLAKKYQPTTKVAMTDTKREFTESSLSSGEDPDVWITELERKRFLLKEMKAPVSEIDMLIHIVTNIPEEYETIVDMHQGRIGASTDPLSVDELRELLNEKFGRLNKSKKSGEEKALFAGKFKGKCSVCGKVGHKAENCWHREGHTGQRGRNSGGPRSNSNSNSGNGGRNSQGNGDGNQGRFTLKCWYCQETGHLRRDCEKKKKEEAEKANAAVDETGEVVLCGVEKSNEDWIKVERRKGKTSEEVALMANGSGMINKHTWIADSGASSHLTNDPDGLYDVKPVDTEIRLGDDHAVKAEKKGKLKVLVKQADGSTIAFVLEDVKYVPKLGYNFFSLTKVVHDKGFEL